MLTGSYHYFANFTVARQLVRKPGVRLQNKCILDDHSKKTGCMVNDCCCPQASSRWKDGEGTDTQ